MFVIEDGTSGIADSSIASETAEMKAAGVRVMPSGDLPAFGALARKHACVARPVKAWRSPCVSLVFATCARVHDTCGTWLGKASASTGEAEYKRAEVLIDVHGVPTRTVPASHAGAVTCATRRVLCPRSSPRVFVCVVWAEQTARLAMTAASKRALVVVDVQVGTPQAGCVSV